MTDIRELASQLLDLEVRVKEYDHKVQTLYSEYERYDRLKEKKYDEYNDARYMYRELRDRLDTVRMEMKEALAGDE
jgi:chromosome segregation ATPase